MAATGFDRVCAYGKGALADDCPVELDGSGVKAVYQNFERTVLVSEVGGVYRPLQKKHLKLY